MDDIPKEETGKQQVGIGINIYDEGKAGADSKYAPSPDPNSKNFDMEKSVLDALSAIGESTQAPSPKDIGNRAENVATAAEKANGAKDAAKDILKANSKSNDSGQQKTWTQDSIKVIWGDNDSISWIVPEKKN